MDDFKVKGGCIFNFNNKKLARAYYFVCNEQEQDLTKRCKYFVFDAFGEEEISREKYHDDCFGMQTSFEYKMMPSSATAFKKASEYFNNFYNRNSFLEQGIMKGAKFFKMY